MKHFNILILFLQCMILQARANVSGQSDQQVPLLNAAGIVTGTTISCVPYSVEYDGNDLEYVKYILDIDEDQNSTVAWTPHTNITVFEDCASYAAGSNAVMFFFDGTTCETSSEGYERKEKTCSSTSAKVVYILKGYVPTVSTGAQPASASSGSEDMGNNTSGGDVGNNTSGGDMGGNTSGGDMGGNTSGGDMGGTTSGGDIGGTTSGGVTEDDYYDPMIDGMEMETVCWEDDDNFLYVGTYERTVTCGVAGRKICLPSTDIKEERKTVGGYVEHIEDVTYIKMRFGCILINVNTTQTASYTMQESYCSNEFEALPCAPTESGPRGNLMIFDIKKFGKQAVAKSTVADLFVGLHYEKYMYNTWIWEPNFIFETLFTDDPQGNYCGVIKMVDTGTGVEPKLTAGDCDSTELKTICCMIGAT